MNTNKKKLLSVSIAVCALSLTGAMLCIPSPTKASAATNGLTMSPGASVRLTTDDDNSAVNGLRFEAKMTKDHYDALQGTEIVLSSTVTANDVTKTVNWVLKGEGAQTPSFSNGVARFYHTLTFDSLFGNAELLKQANASDFEAYFELDSNVDEEDWRSQTETRSMRQVAYKAYNTPGTQDEPNEGYQNGILLKYFTEGEAAESTYSSTSSDERTVREVFGETVYAEYENIFQDVSNVVMKDLYAGGATPKFVAFDENNVAHEKPVQVATMISTEQQMKDLLTNGKTKNGEYYALTNNITISQLPNFADYVDFKTSSTKVAFNATLDGNGYTLYTPQRSLGLFGTLNLGAAVKNMKIVVDISTAVHENGALFGGNYNQNLILGFKMQGSLENLYVKLVGDSAKAANGFALVGFNTEAACGTYKNLVLDYADVLPANPNKSDAQYNSLFSIHDFFGDFQNINVVSTTTNWMKMNGAKTVDDFAYATLYADVASIPDSALSAKYWDTKGAYPVWKTDRLADDNQVVWSANTSKAYVANGLLPDGEEVKTVTDVLGTTYYENGEWKNTESFPEAVGETTTVRPFYKTVDVEGVNGTKVRAVLNAWNRAIATASDLDFIQGKNTTYTGKYIMVDNVTVDSWTTAVYNNTNFNGVFDGNGYTLAYSGRANGLFGKIGPAGVVKNTNIVFTAQEGVTLNNGNGVVLAFWMDGLLENLYIQIKGKVSSGQGTGLYIGSRGTVENNDVTATIKNVVVDAGTAYDNYQVSDHGSYSLLRPVSASAMVQDVYVISPMKGIVGSSGTKATIYCAKNDATGAENEVIIEGVRRYQSVQAIADDQSTEKVLTGFNAAFWDTTSGAPVWRTK